MFVYETEDERCRKVKYSTLQRNNDVFRECLRTGSLVECQHVNRGRVPRYHFSGIALTTQR